MEESDFGDCSSTRRNASLPIPAITLKLGNSKECYLRATTTKVLLRTKKIIFKDSVCLLRLRTLQYNFLSPRNPTNMLFDYCKARNYESRCKVKSFRVNSNQ